MIAERSLPGEFTVRASVLLVLTATAINAQNAAEQNVAEIPLSYYQGAIAISGDQQLIMTGGDAIRVFHFRTLHPWSAKDLLTPGLTYNLAASPVAPRVFAAGEYHSGSGAEIRVMKAGAKTPLQTFRHPRGFNCVSLAFTSDGQLLSLGRRDSAQNPAGELRVWNLDSGALEKHLELPALRPQQLTYSPETDQVAISLSDQAGAVSVRLMSRRDWATRHVIALPSTYVRDLAFVPGTNTLLVAAMNLSAMPRIKHGQIWKVTPDAEQQVTDLRTSREDLMYVGLRVSPDGRTFVVRSARQIPGERRGRAEQPEVQLRSTQSGKLLWRTETKELMHAFAFTDDSQRLLACGGPLLIELDCHDGKLLRERLIGEDR